MLVDKVRYAPDLFTLLKYPIEIKKTSNPGTEFVKVFDFPDKSSIPRAKGAVICMKPVLGAIDIDNYIVAVWVI